MREVTIALAQTAPVLNDNEENLRRMGSSSSASAASSPPN